MDEVDKATLDEWLKKQAAQLKKPTTRLDPVRAVALQAAAQSWAGISAIRDRDSSVLKTAEKFEEWLRR